MYVQKLLIGLLVLSISCVYLIATVYLIPTPWDSKPKTFCIMYCRGFGCFSIIFYSLVTLTCVYFGYHTAIIGVISFFGIVLSVLLLSMIEREYKTWSRVFMLCGVPILVKLSHSTYFSVDVLLAEKVQWDLFYYLITSEGFELFLLLFWSLLPVLSVKCEPYPKLTFTIWNTEFINICYGSFLVILYGVEFKNAKGEWDDRILNVLFGFHITNVFAFALPLYLQRLSDGKRFKIVKYAPFYLLAMHLVCDIGIVTALYWAENYVNKYIFIFTVFFKIMVFSIEIWAAVSTMSDGFDLTPLALWTYSVDEVNDD